MTIMNDKDPARDNHEEEHDRELRAVETTSSVGETEPTTTNEETTILSEKDPVGEQPQARQYIMEQPSSSHKGLIITALSVVTVAFITAGSLLYWYFGLRVADIEYEKASAIVDVMITDAEELQESKSSLDKESPSLVTTASVIPTDTRADFARVLKKLSEAKEKAAEYLYSQEALQRSMILKKDESVKAVYDANKKAINEYGVSSDLMYRTTYIFFTVLQYCVVGTNDSSSEGITTLEAYDQEVKLCEDYLENHDTVPAKEFNETIYVPYRSLLLALITNTRTLLEEPPYTEVWNQALKNIEETGQEAKEIDTSEVQSIDNSQNPKSQLEKVKAKIEERRKVFFR